MTSTHALATALALTCLTAACDSNEGPSDGVAELRLMHARSGAPAVNLVVDGETVAGGIGFTEASGFAVVEAGSADIEIRPAGGGATLSSAATELASGGRYTLLFSNSGSTTDLRISADTAPGVPTEPPPPEPDDTASIPGESKIKLRVIHNAADAPPLDVYLSLYETPIEGAAKLVGPFLYGVGLNPEFPGYVERDPGTYRLRFTSVGTLAVLLDTGPIGMAAGQVRSVILFSSDSTGLGLANVRER